MRLLRLLALAALVALPALRAAAAPAAAPAEPAKAEAPKELRFTKHSRQRMIERGVTEAEVRAVVEKGETFRYFHQGKWKTGYYDGKDKLFIAADDGTVITVITNASRGYVERLKRKKP